MELNQETPLISVIVPIYNSEKYLMKCIDSICSQTYTNLEIILVNDGSTDKSITICNQFADKDPRILIKDIPNGGVSNARNTGVQVSKGRYIQFIDSDDYIAETYIKTMYETLQKQDTQLSICAIESFNNTGKLFD